MALSAVRNQLSKTNSFTRRIDFVEYECLIVGESVSSEKAFQWRSFQMETHYVVCGVLRLLINSSGERIRERI